MSDLYPEPSEVSQLVEDFIDRELNDARKYTNRTPLDSSGSHSLHRLAARIYAMGWRDGDISGAQRQRASSLRATEYGDGTGTAGGEGHHG